MRENLLWVVQTFRCGSGRKYFVTEIDTKSISSALYLRLYCYKVYTVFKDAKKCTLFLTGQEILQLGLCY